jgi:hypothetical protein
MVRAVVAMPAAQMLRAKTPQYATKPTIHRTVKPTIHRTVNPMAKVMGGILVIQAQMLSSIPGENSMTHALRATSPEHRTLKLEHRRTRWARQGFCGRRTRPVPKARPLENATNTLAAALYTP